LNELDAGGGNMLPDNRLEFANAETFLESSANRFACSWDMPSVENEVSLIMVVSQLDSSDSSSIVLEQEVCIEGMVSIVDAGFRKRLEAKTKPPQSVLPCSRAGTCSPAIFPALEEVSSKSLTVLA